MFDMAAIVCKRRGDNYEMKDILDLNNFKVTNNPTTDKEGKKVSGDTCPLSVFFFNFERLTFFYERPVASICRNAILGNVSVGLYCCNINV